jgi:hypothetical protein
MNVVLHKILGTLDDQVRGRTTSGNTHKCYLRQALLLKLSLLMGMTLKRISISLFAALCQDLPQLREQ